MVFPFLIYLSFLSLLLLIIVAFISSIRSGGVEYENSFPSPEEERLHKRQWLIEHFQQFPQKEESVLRQAYPELYKIAMATKRYKELEVLRQQGVLDEIDYELELQKILPLIDITAALKAV